MITDKAFVRLVCDETPQFTLHYTELERIEESSWKRILNRVELLGNVGYSITMREVEKGHRFCIDCVRDDRTFEFEQTSDTQNEIKRSLANLKLKFLMNTGYDVEY